MTERQPWRGLWLLVLYPPLSCVAVGLLGLVMRLPVPETGSRAPGEVFRAYALRFPEDSDALRWAALALGWVCLLLLTVALRSSEPVLTVAEVRIALLVLIAVITVVVDILSVVRPLASPWSEGDIPHDSARDVTTTLFMFVDVDLILAFAATFLPHFKPLRRRLV